MERKEKVNEWKGKGKGMGVKGGRMEGIMRKNLCPGAPQCSQATYSSSVSGEQPLAQLTILLLESALCGGLLKWVCKNEPLEPQASRCGSLSKKAYCSKAQLCLPCKGPGICAQPFPVQQTSLVCMNCLPPLQIPSWYLLKLSALIFLP